MRLDEVEFALQEMPGDVLHRALRALPGPTGPCGMFS